MTVSTQNSNRAASIWPNLPHELIEEVIKYFTPSELEQLARSSPEFACLIFRCSKIFTDIFIGFCAPEPSFIPRNIKAVLSPQLQSFFCKKAMTGRENVHELMERLRCVESFEWDQTQESLDTVKSILEIASEKGANSLVQSMLKSKLCGNINFTQSFVKALTHSNQEIANQLIKRVEWSDVSLSDLTLLMVVFCNTGFSAGVEKISRLREYEYISKSKISLALHYAITSGHTEIIQILLDAPQLNEL